MARSVFVTSAEGQAGKSTVALGLLQLLTRETGSVGIFRPVTADADQHDQIVQLMLEQAGGHQDYDTAIGVAYRATHEQEEVAQEEILDRFHAVAAAHDVVLVLGSDFTDVSIGAEAALNASIAANLGSQVVLVVPGVGRSPQSVLTAVEVAVEELRNHHAQVVSVVVNRAEPEHVEAIRSGFESSESLSGVTLGGVLPEAPLLDAPTVADLVSACDGTVLQGNPDWMHREVGGFVVAAMSMPNILTRLVPDAAVIAPGDRYDVLPGLILAHQSGTFPTLSAIVLTGGYEPPESVIQLINGSHLDLPIIVTSGGTFDTTSRLSRVHGRMTPDATAKVQTALRNFAEYADTAALLSALQVPESTVMTPMRFGYLLLERARRDRKRIVLPEGEEPRIIEAAATVLRQGLADLIILGDESKINAVASKLGVDISGAQIVSPHDPELVERFAEEFAQIRAKKGMTVDQARDIITDVSYFGTMMVHNGMADGMVSGSVHTTAHTIRPSLQIIKTRPGTLVVSSVFLMLLADKVLIYGDCAVNPDPTMEQLADIAVTSARSARQFGVEPVVAMCSYSTGSSAGGADVDKVRDATELVRTLQPDLPVDGPMQYDAAVEPSVAASKMPGSPVAGHASVLIFPDLNTGNNTYKAVQRSAGAVAIGPVLQGLNQPVNDLSRGSHVDDIVNTIAITAIQAQGES